MLFYIGIMIAVMQVGAQFDILFQGCSYSRCHYYARLSQQPSSLLQQAGYRLYMQCNCRSFGVSLYTGIQPTRVPVYNTNAPPVYTKAPPQPQCGSSSVTGSASNYLDNQRARVVGGKNAAECEFPWMVFLKIGGKSCGGTIIDSKRIVTAAHCLRSGYNSVTDARSIQVGVGSSYKNNLRYYNARSVTIHPRYNSGTFDYDIGVIVLQTALPTNSRCVKPICLPNQYNLRTGTKCTVAGWGLTQANTRYTPNNLQKAMVPIVSTESCKQSYGSYTISSMKICAGYASGGIDACQGDSGGPLMCAEGNSWVLAGVVSFGNGCAQPNFPGVYSNVRNLREWVQSIN